MSCKHDINWKNFYVLWFATLVSQYTPITLTRHLQLQCHRQNDTSYEIGSVCRRVAWRNFPFRFYLKLKKIKKKDKKIKWRKRVKSEIFRIFSPQTVLVSFRFLPFLLFHVILKGMKSSHLPGRLDPPLGSETETRAISSWVSQMRINIFFPPGFLGEFIFKPCL